ncbi:(2Fe-2S)-binding protein [Uliginosibacterium paludis]|uniref:Bacterioferritin-associated ferredoxin n=1 Tax=Uliginosibacterium paludis TaxID=1615952 RepID=A0ABV2CM26_9RHOO
MYVCVCHAVTDRDITRAAANGARTVRDLRDTLGVTSSCGRCAQCAHACLKAAHAGHAQPVSLLRRAEEAITESAQRVLAAA